MLNAMILRIYCSLNIGGIYMYCYSYSNWRTVYIHHLTCFAHPKKGGQVRGLAAMFADVIIHFVIIYFIIIPA